LVATWRAEHPKPAMTHPDYYGNAQFLFFSMS